MEPEDASELEERVGIRQIQRKAKTEADQVLRNVEFDADWWTRCESSNRNVNSQANNSVEDFGGVGAPANQEQAGADFERSFIVDVPTKTCDLFSDVCYSGSSDDDVPNSSDLTVLLRKWYVDKGIKLDHLGSLLTDVLKPFHPELPSDPRTIARTPRTTVIKQLNTGVYVHLGLEKGLLMRLESGLRENSSTTLYLDVNMDGLQLSLSSNVEAWPVLVRCQNLVDNKPFAVGLFCGESKPEPVDDYLDDYITEVNKLQKDGVSFKGKIYNVKIQRYILDRPGRAHVKCIVGHGSSHGCERCSQEGEHDGSRMTYEFIKGNPRTDKAFARQNDELHHKGISPLTKIKGTLFVSMFTLDPMHLLWHEVVKRLLQFICGKYPSYVKLSAKDVAKLSETLSSLECYIPREFSRKCRSLKFLGRFKATEYRLFLLYVGIVVLKCEFVETRGVYAVFLLLHVALRIFSHPEMAKNSALVDYADSLLNLFVKQCAKPKMFGKSFVVFNVHSLLHLCEDVRRYGMLDNFSAFPFENHLGVIKRMVRSGVKVAQQISRRLAEMDEVPSVVTMGSVKLSPSGFNESSGEYRSLSCTSYTLTPDSESERDSFCKLEHGHSIGQVKKIFKDVSGDVSVLVDVCEEPTDFFTYPTSSKVVGVYKFTERIAHNVRVKATAISGKCMVLPHQGEKVAIQLLHTH